MMTDSELVALACMAWRHHVININRWCARKQKPPLPQQMERLLNWERRTLEWIAREKQYQPRMEKPT